MKKAISLILVLTLILAVPVFAAASEIDLSSLSWSELIALKAAISKEQMTRDEWQEVSVPQGVYKVGEDIPAGKWTITSAGGMFFCDFEWGTKLGEDGHSISWDGLFDSAMIGETPGAMKEYTVELKDGYWIVISMTDAVFKPFTGKPALGFK